MNHEFVELQGGDKIIENPGEFQGLFILKAGQSIRFRLDRSGATVTSEAQTFQGAIPREFIVDRPFLIVIKRRSATAAVESLHLTYPEQYATDVRTPAREIWTHNPRITTIADDEPDVRMLDVHYPSINRCNQEHIPFLGGYCEYLGQQLGVSLSLKVNRPQLYLSDQEKKWIDQIQHHVTDGRPVPFWLVSPYRAIFDDLLSKWRKDADR